MEFLYNILGDTNLLEVLLVEVGLTPIEAGTNETRNVSAHNHIGTVQMQALQAKEVKALIKNEEILCFLIFHVANVAQGRFGLQHKLDGTVLLLFKGFYLL